eukprot:CAMPEP_0197439280 /NCGR_PEP_ID=MMETSP1175-20131217/6059_1 /TAXON_ID=1003142 /ORGANISM="Triceratium dubium, Strain CCMP147" /LENGTH=785 /DNA_ID=CAMNT_0042969161 /DNA_START=36 /DNA_END=2393 /DNA_ORIENTATION=+
MGVAVAAAGPTMFGRCRRPAFVAAVVRRFLLLLLWLLFLTSPIKSSLTVNAALEETMRTFQKGEAIPLYVNAVTSTHTQLPRDFYRLPFCQPEAGPRMHSGQNLGQFIDGDFILTSPYQIEMLQEQYCQKLCQITLSNKQVDRLGHHIRQGYHNNWILDNLPSAVVGINLAGFKTKRYNGGFPLGFVAQDYGSPYVYNRVNIQVQYYDDTRAESEGGYRVVGFAVEPLSVEHAWKDGFEWDGMSEEGYDKTLATCPDSGEHLSQEGIERSQVLKPGTPVLFTYDVIWEWSEVKWSDRWGVYVTEDHLVPNQVHIYSIINSALIVLVFASVIALVVVGNSRKNDVPVVAGNDSNIVAQQDGEPTSAVSSTESDDEMLLQEQELEEKGLVVVNIDVFNAPQCAQMLLSLCCGMGAQLLSSLFVTVGCTAIFYDRYLGPAHRGHFVQFTLLSVALMGPVNGYVTSRFYKAFGGDENDWKGVAKVAALAFPGMTFAAFVFMNVVHWCLGSTKAVPLLGLLLILVMWLGISVPLVYAGAYAGFRQNAFQLSPPNCPRSILLGNILHRRFLNNMTRCSRCCIIVVALLLNSGSIMLALLWLLRRLLVQRKFWSPTWGGAVMLLIGGILSFGFLYVELFFIMTSLWMYQTYYSFGYLFLVLSIQTVKCAEVSILFDYYRLCSKECHSWWWQFSCGGAISFWIFISSFFNFARLGPSGLYVYLVYFSFMFWVSLSVYLMMGFVGLIASIYFNRIIFRIAKSRDDYRPLLSAEEEGGERNAMELSSPDEQPQQE